ncbi:MAG: hypothetical protein ACT4RN_08910 [Pseudonocardia sp.]
MTAFARLVALVATVLALVALTAGPAAAHAGDPTLVTRMDAVNPALPPGVTVEVRATVADQLVVTNSTPTPLVALDPDGAEFLRIDASGVQGNTVSPYFHLSAAPSDIRVPIPPTAAPGAPPVWVPLSAEGSWAWFDPRLSPAFLQVPVGGRQADVQDAEDVAVWSVPLRYGAEPLRVDGALERRPVAGRFETVIDPLPAGVSAVLGQGYVPTLSMQTAPGREVTVLGRDGQPYLRFGAAGAEVNRDSPTYRDDLLGRGRLPGPADVGWGPLPGVTTWLDTRLRFPAEDPPAAVADATAPAEVARWEVPVIVDGTPQALRGAIVWVPNGRDAGSPCTTGGIFDGVALLRAGGALLLRRNRRLATAAASAAAAVTLVACGQSTLTPTVTPDGAQRVELRRGDVARYAVPLNAPVELVVSSDVADEVHVHGYDRSSFVTAGASTTIRFVADRPGVYEVELELTGEPLGQLAVS